MTGATGGVRVSFAVDGDAVRITDELEGEDFLLETDVTPTLQPALPDLFPVPVDRAVSFETAAITVPNHANAVLRDEQGDVIEALIEPSEWPTDTYLIELTGVVRTYLRLERTAFSVLGDPTDEALKLELDEESVISVGARSFHSRPEATITVPNNPSAMMSAVSYLGSSIKEFSSERSWPTLRGHPPRIQLGEQLHVPDELQQPETGITITVPAAYDDIFRVAPLAFYLGAEVTEGEEPAIRLDNGYVEPLGTSSQSVSEHVRHLLGRFLLLDSLTRMEGYVPSRRHEYEAIGEDLPFYPPNLYTRSLSEQVMEYLEVDRRTLKKHIPDAIPIATLRPQRSDVELLSHLAHGLSAIRIDDTLPNPTIHVPSRGEWPTDKSERDEVENSILLKQTYEHDLNRPLASVNDLSVVVITGDHDRATRFRNEFTDSKRTRQLADRIRVVADPRAEQVRRVFAEGFDLIYCDLQTRGERIHAANTSVEISSLNPESALVVFESCQMDTGKLLATRSGATVGVTNSEAPDRCVRSFAESLASGLPIGESAEASGLNEVSDIRFAGDPRRQLANSHEGLPPILITVGSLSSEKYCLSARALVTSRYRVGGEYTIEEDWGTEYAHLTGSTVQGTAPVELETVSEVIKDDVFIVNIRDEIFFDAIDLNEEKLDQLLSRTNEVDKRL